MDGYDMHEMGPCARWSALLAKIGMVPIGFLRITLSSHDEGHPTSAPPLFAWELPIAFVCIQQIDKYNRRKFMNSENSLSWAPRLRMSTVEDQMVWNRVNR